MSSSNCCFLTCIQVSQEVGQVVLYFHLFQNFPWFIMIHTVKGFGIVNKAEVDVFLELSCFFDDPMDVGDLISGSSAFSKTSLNTDSWTWIWANSKSKPHYGGQKSLVCTVHGFTRSWTQWLNNSNFRKKEKKLKSLSRVWLFATPWTVAYQAPPSMGFSRQEYWSRLPFPSLISVSL